MNWNTALLLLSACVSCSLSLPVSEAQPDSDPFHYSRHYGRHYGYGNRGGHGYGNHNGHGYGHHDGYGYGRHGYGQQREKKSFDLKGAKPHFKKYGFKVVDPVKP